MFDKINTKVKAIVIPTAFIIDVVIANAGHKPSSWTNNGFPVKIPSLKIEPKETLFSFLLILSTSYLEFALS
jgi:hypothetical protein